LQKEQHHASLVSNASVPEVSRPSAIGSNFKKMNVNQAAAAIE